MAFIPSTLLSLVSSSLPMPVAPPIRASAVIWVPGRTLLTSLRLVSLVDTARKQYYSRSCGPCSMLFAAGLHRIGPVPVLFSE
ncbi:hypothetical protein DFH06DRAFT_1223123 [Mycena polygramma]|nr:hypothetical protein DFH06DRAFT_1223123 [Mycena polygramma]